ncbi:MAG: anthranilate synthase component I family protein [Bacteroidota bacterium]
MSSTIHLHTTLIEHTVEFDTPISLYLKLRDHFLNPILLESNYHLNERNARSIIALDPIASFQVQKGVVRETLPNGEVKDKQLDDPLEVSGLFQKFIQRFEVDMPKQPNLVNGFFGYSTFDSIQYFETIEFPEEKRLLDIPDVYYALYRYVIVTDHPRQVVYVIQNLQEGEEADFERIETLVRKQTFAAYDFQKVGEKTSNLTDEQHRDMIRKGKHHCKIGDVFQIVLSRQFQQGYQGDEFNVYRALRRINPSPYLFYFDYGSFKIFGSSPEAQMVINNGVATVNPIAGTYRRTGDWERDQELGAQLLQDPKETAEHIMLVDLARNDLGRHAKRVEIERLKTLEYYSHVIHIVSSVKGHLPEDVNPIQVFGDTFPAGTLSGAPKYKAIQLINEYENQNRSYYGGAIGFVNLNGDMNQAILIRSFLAKDNTLYFQAGGGIVFKSDEETEVQEVQNKLGALMDAIEEAEKA